MGSRGVSLSEKSNGGRTSFFILFRGLRNEVIYQVIYVYRMYKIENGFRGRVTDIQGVTQDTGRSHLLVVRGVYTVKGSLDTHKRDGPYGEGNM